jgi:hypothetical protein
MTAGRCSASTLRQREAWRGRSARRNYLKKQSLGRIVIADVPHEQLIRFVLAQGLTARPRGRELRFKEAAAALDVWLRELLTTGCSRVTIKKLLLGAAGDVLEDDTATEKETIRDASSIEKTHYRR